MRTTSQPAVRRLNWVRRSIDCTRELHIHDGAKFFWFACMKPRDRRPRVE